MPLGELLGASPRGIDWTDIPTTFLSEIDTDPVSLGTRGFGFKVSEKKFHLELSKISPPHTPYSVQITAKTHPPARALFVEP